MDAYQDLFNENDIYLLPLVANINFNDIPAMRCNHVRGGCLGSSGYSHDVIHCLGCKKAMLYAKYCSWDDCICNRQALIFPVEGDDKIVLHQIPSMNNSVRIHLNRKKQSIERIRNPKHSSPKSSSKSVEEDGDYCFDLWAENLLNMDLIDD